MIEFLEQPWVQRLVYGFGGLLLGFLLERVVIDRVRGLAARTRFRWDDLLIKSLRGLPTIWLGAIGAYFALNVGGVDAGVRDAAIDVLTIVSIGAAVVAGMRLAGGAAGMLSAEPASPIQSPTLVINLAKLAVGILGGFIILQNLGIEITPLITALGIGGLAVALALQDTLGNLFAGVQIILSRVLRPGDYVMLSTAEEGFVSDVKWRHTTIETFPDGNLVTVPNSVLAASIVKNYTFPAQALWVSIDVGISYDSDLERAEEVTLDVARKVLTEVPGSVQDREPIMIYKAFGASSIDFEVRLMVRDFRSQGPVRHEFIKRLHRRFGEEGIEIPFPIRTVVLKGKTPD